MHIDTVFAALPEFLPAEPSLFMRSLLDSLAESTPLNSSAARNHSPASLDHAISSLQGLYREFARVVEPLQKRSDAYKRRLDAWGVWQQYSPVELPITPKRALQPLCGIVHTYPEIQTALQQGIVPENIVFRSAWKFIAWRYGHRAVYEGDIASPRFAEDTRATFLQVLALKPLRKYDDEFPATMPITLKGRLLGGTWAKYVAAQHEIEQCRSKTMQGVYAVKQDIVRFSEELVRKERILRTEDLWNNSLEDLLAYLR